MSTYIQYKTFATRAAFLSWRTSLGSATAGAWSVTITQTGEQLNFSINVSKPIQQAGLYDRIVYDKTDACFKAFPQSILRCPRTSTNLTGKYCQLSEVYLSGLSNCVDIGTVIQKSGGKLKIADIEAAKGLAWAGDSSGYAEDVANVHTATALQNGQGGAWGTCAWDWFLTNRYYASNTEYTGYWIGVTKSAWDTAVASHKSTGTRASGAVTAVSGQISGTYYVQDYNYDYDLFQRRNVLCRFPAKPAYVNAPLNGREQTQYIMHGYTNYVPYAAKYCVERSKGVAGFNAGDWWLPTVDEAIAIERAKAAKGDGGYMDIWACVQCNAAVAWLVYLGGLVGYDYKYYTLYSVPVSALDIQNL